MALESLEDTLESARFKEDFPVDKADGPAKRLTKSAVPDLAAAGPSPSILLLLLLLLLLSISAAGASKSKSKNLRRNHRARLCQGPWQSTQITLPNACISRTAASFSVCEFFSQMAGSRHVET